MSNIELDFKDVKKLFGSVIKYINDNDIKLDSETKENIKILIIKWKNNQGKDIDYYFYMK